MADEPDFVPDLIIQPRRVSKTATTAPTEAFQEIGTTGLRQYGGFVLEEWLQSLSGRRAAWVWREMLDNDPTVGAIMFAIKWLARGVEWRVEEGARPEDAELVEQAMHDMSHTWGDFISEVLSFLPYGWSWHEIVYKQRQGPQQAAPPKDQADAEVSEDGTQEDDSNPASSDYKDGLIGWRKMPVRAQETLLHWEFNGYSGISAMNQVDWHGGNHIIPIEKSLLFRTQTTRGNPEGRSILRNAFTSYYRLKNINAIEAIGIERDLAGIPVMTPPDTVNLTEPGNAALYSKVKQIVTNIRRDEYEGIVLPTNGWTFELVSSAGARQIDTDAITRRYRSDIATSMLADFVLIGQDSVGSFAMVDVKSDLFGLAIDGILDLICEVMNSYAIPRLLQINGRDPIDPPRIEHASAGRIDLEKVGSFLFQLEGAGAPIPWSNQLLTELFKSAGLPANFEEDAAEPVPVVPDPTEDAAGNEIEQHAAGPPMLPPGSLPFAREAHSEPGPAPAAPAPETAGQPSENGKQKPKPVTKAQTQGHVVYNVADSLQDRHAVLSAQLEQEINSALNQLGESAAASFRGIAHKGAGGGMLHRLVGRVLRSLNLSQWVDQHLKPILANHAGRVTADTLRTIQTQIDQEVSIGEDDAHKIADQAGNGLGLKDIEPQIRQSIMQAIKQGLDAGENPVRTADRIRDMVPAGRFVNAGAKYRSRLISRNETANYQRAASLAAYDSNDNITGVRLRDGIFGPPRSDAYCMSRDGQEIPKADAATAQPDHPQCTLAYDPIVTGSLPDDSGSQPELVTA